LCLSAARAALRQGGIEVSRRIAKRDPTLAIGGTTIRLAFDALINRNDVLGPRAEHLHGPAQENAPRPIKRQQIGRAVTFAGHYENASTLQCGVGNQVGFPMTIVATRSGSCMTSAWSTFTVIVSAARAGIAPIMQITGTASSDNLTDRLQCFDRIDIALSSTVRTTGPQKGLTGTLFPELTVNW
jgi:hypothetical protein